ncbi:MAG TPA: DUF5686 and carboxypeptidase regulatory-like domain-containing protein [Chitinophagaceae bacterium]
MRNILFCVFFIGSSLFSFSQKVSGIVTDSTGKGIPYASVFIKGTNRGTNANNEGKYFLELEPGQYTLVCQSVNYKKEEKVVVCGVLDVVLNFELSVQEVILEAVIISTGEDPAYGIIRNTIKKRTYYQDQLNKFQCEVYTKGQLRVRSYPKKFFGKKVDFEDGDTSKQKMLYLSETVSLYTVNKPAKERIEVISSKVSGQSDGYGLSAPQFFSFYDNNVFIGNNLNPRGFISPISDNALNFYKYKYEGSFYEDGKEVTRILVIPRRKYEPLFSGHINIVEDEWRIHSLRLLLTKESQMQLIDSLTVEQLYRPLKNDIWAISSQVIYPSAKIFGFDAYGSFINIYSNFNIDREFDKKYFSSTILKYTDSSNKKDAAYWEEARPIPLMADEIYDYKRKDSLEIVRKDPQYMDSLDKIRNKINMFGALLFEQTLVTQRKRTSFSFRPLTEQFSFNVAEGFVINTGAVWTKQLDTTFINRRSISIAPNLRYGFTNQHFNAHLTTIYHFGKRKPSSLSLSGGKRIFQFNNNSPIGPRGNTLSSLLGENNRMKIYEAIYFRGSLTRGIGNAFTWNLAFQYQDRLPLENKTDYTWRDKSNKEYTPNYPNELVSQNIIRHQVFVTLLGLTWQPGTKYIELPDRRINLGSKYPVFSFQYIRSIDDFLGSDGDFSKWKFGIKDDLNFKLRGKFSYRLGIGGFLDNKKVQVPDYQHFNGNISTFATEFLNSFQLLPLYQFSNTDKFYALAHLQHNFNGFLTNKIPGFRKLNVFLVVAANAFYLDKDRNYLEYSVGFDNIFKQFRIDYVMSRLDGKRGDTGFRIGFRQSLKPRGDDWP